MIFTTAKQAADDPRILVFGRLLGAANRLEYILGHALEESTGLTHSIYELLLVVGRAGGDGVPVRDVAQSRVVTSGGATRLVNRAVELGLIRRRSEIAALVPGLSARMLTVRLQQLETADLVERTVTPTIPVSVRYRLTARGDDLITALRPIAGHIQRWNT